MIRHLPVLLREVLEVLHPVPGGVYVDATIGLGGHAGEIMQHLGPQGMMIGIDRDEKALEVARDHLSGSRVILKKGSFSDLSRLLAGEGIDRVHGVLFDFGVSMLQLRDMDRGFSFDSDAPLDMRMDTSRELTAADIVNTFPGEKVKEILKEYGEEWLAAPIVRAILLRRRNAEIRSCRELAGIVAGVYGKRGRRGKIHPATKTFQALRIAVNDELGEIRTGLEASLNMLHPGGRLCAISYHSLEDRIVKNFMREADRGGTARLITKKPLTASPEEIRENPAARSAKLRAAEKA